MENLNFEEFTLWRYLLSIESMLAHSRQFCEIAPGNYQVYSDEYAKILILASIHFEHCAKMLVEKWRPNADTSDMGKIRTILTEQRPGIVDLSLGVFGANIILNPLSDCTRGRKAEWWDGYTHVKHDYVNSKIKGNQLNAINSTASCVVLLLYYFETHRMHLWPDCAIITYPRPRFLYDANDITPLP